ncbi:hypothetical protein FGO68_gene5171 [Halteria grandinella]|uniref:Transmembrane protein n=1 Tax=Halteria grandinella TaxID=5974 RepID=A0A8J8P9Q6_HALGN|nr:hypothetical protein FGO68_gene5171 [Halteria grandinella]
MNNVIDKIRERNFGDLQQKNANQTFEQMNNASKYYKHFSPQIWLWSCRVSIFIWVYAYHDFQSWIMLAWLMHSTLFKSTRTFIGITITYYLPIFCAIFLFYYVINIPRVVEFPSLGDGVQLDLWRTYGFYQFSYPFLEIILMLTALIPFVMVIKTRKQLDENSKKDAKKQFLEKLTSPQSPTIYYLLFVIINNLDIVAFTTIFFSGVNKIDFYHIFLIFFFVAFTLYPRCFIRNYIILLVYVDFFVFEKYLYTLITHYIPADSWIVGVATVLGLSTEYDDVTSQKYFRYVPKFQQWLLIIVVFLQYQVHQIIKDEKVVNRYQQNARDNFKKRYPRIFHIWEIFQHLKKEFLILVSFMIFFIIIIVTTKSIINWGFQIILCIFIITYIGVSNDTSSSGIRRLSKVWFLIIWYSSILLLMQITYQFAALPIVRKALDIDDFLNILPLWIRENIDIIGFTVYTTFIWEKFLTYILYFAIGVYVQKQMRVWEAEDAEKGVNPLNFHQRKNPLQMKMVIQSINSDKQPYDEKENIKDWHKEFQNVRFTTPYLVYKFKKLWVIIDKVAQSSFVLTSVMIMVLSNYWQISLSMAIHLTCFIGLCLLIASSLYANRKKDKKELDNKKDEEGKKRKSLMTVYQCGEHWTEYKKKVNLIQVAIRQKVWLFQFIFTLLCMVAIYPTEFIYQIRQTFVDQGETEVVNALNCLIFYLFWGGVYHSPYNVSKHGYFYNFYGYLIILILLIFEKNGQQWALNRFGCTYEKAKLKRSSKESKMRSIGKRIICKTIFICLARSLRKRPRKRVMSLIEALGILQISIRLSLQTNLSWTDLLMSMTIKRTQQRLKMKLL